MLNKIGGKGHPCRHPFLIFICCVNVASASNFISLFSFLRHFLEITKLDKEKNQCIRKKTGAQNIVKEIKQYQKKWLQHVQRMETNRLP